MASSRREASLYRSSRGCKQDLRKALEGFAIGDRQEGGVVGVVGAVEGDVAQRFELCLGAV